MDPTRSAAGAAGGGRSVALRENLCPRTLTRLRWSRSFLPSFLRPFYGDFWHFGAISSVINPF